MPAHQRFEALLADVLARLRAAPSADVEDVLPLLARFFGADRVHFRRVRLDRLGWEGDHVFTRPGAAMGLAPSEHASAAGPTWIQRSLLAGAVVRVDRLAEPAADLPVEAVRELGAQRRAGVAALLDVPLHGLHADVVACLGLRRCDATRPWTDGDVRRLQLVGNVIASLIDARGPATVPEIARLRRAAELSERLEERLFAAMEVATIGFFDWDVGADRVWYLSPFAVQRPYPRDTFETSGADWFRATHPDDVPRGRGLVDAAVEGRAEFFDSTVRMRIPHYRDGWVHVRSRGKVLGRDAQGRALRIVGIYEDVTAAVRHAAVEREREVALEHATRSAALGTLATSLAHELNQPLAALTSFVQAAAHLLGDGDGRQGEVKEALRRSAELAEKASEIVRRMRRLVQHRAPHLEPMDLRVVLGTVMDLLRRDAAVAQVELRLGPGAGPAVVQGDRIQLEQVLVNLVRNAIEASAVGEGGHRFVTLATRAARRRVEVSIEDSGPGIRADVLERLFEPFVTTKPTGTGLGLTISRSIVEAHGGALRVERTGPEGTTFVVTLPTTGEETHGQE
ncbi:MAG TPA: ATP-binding protein [Gemmatimonadales bacterium]|nr:ATP-binding protein [Gemmatimonadales bacterium]